MGFGSVKNFKRGMRRRKRPKQEATKPSMGWPLVMTLMERQIVS
jgi:hypothetical protein